MNKYISKEEIGRLVSSHSLKYEYAPTDWRDGLLLGNGEVGFRVTLAVALATALTVVAAKIIGSSLPLLAKKIKLDPAVMASPFITTLVDAISLILYFLIALAILP